MEETVLHPAHDASHAWKGMLDIRHKVCDARLEWRTHPCCVEARQCPDKNCHATDAGLTKMGASR